MRVEEGERGVGDVGQKEKGRSGFTRSPGTASGSAVAGLAARRVDSPGRVRKGLHLVHMSALCADIPPSDSDSDSDSAGDSSHVHPRRGC